MHRKKGKNKKLVEKTKHKIIRVSTYWWIIHIIYYSMAKKLLSFSGVITEHIIREICFVYIQLDCNQVL